MTKDLIVEKSAQNEAVDNNSFALKVENLSKIYDSSAGRVVALDNVSFAIKKGEFVSVVGPSGSGKSTVLNLVGALDRPTNGKIYIDGIDIFSLNDSEIATMRNGRIGFIFQSFNLINRTTVHKNVKLPGVIAGMSSDDVNSRAIKILEALGIADKKNQKPVNLSGGQQQRVAIARSLINNPTIILADEPTGNLDTKTGDDVFDMLKMLSHKFKRTIVMVTHNPELAESTDRSILLRDGRIEKDVVN
ncbi:MAG: ABC transporter ATP-binding protein [Thaumarchaeota archaeon]|nr:ABC transporter ATP-binding protein [Nitrososphaerota archaeon]MDE1817072.1 ABC transporter ATP-binding protein [Nitrososphaerota archaeon]MDE1876004.1 ABC transporter ATP-binding protein [Nitrososphaerota archaeon]